MMDFKKIYIGFIFGLVFSTCSGQTSGDKWPQVWITYEQNNGNYESDFQDLVAHGIDAVEVGIWGIEGNNHAEEILKAARKTGLKIIIGIPEISEQAFKIPDSEVERAVMLGGAYKGKAIDRNVFSFLPKKHRIVIESPVYDQNNCYGTLGRYYPNSRAVRAEVIIKEKNFNRSQHLQVIPATIKHKHNHNWQMEFDLTGTKAGDKNIMLATYWISEGTRSYWMFGDAASSFAQSTKEQLQKEVQVVINSWKQANKGIFPNEVVAVRFGDECFHLSGHLNSSDCSYPVWDFSDSAIKNFQQHESAQYPRGVGFIGFYGREAYAKWMFHFHASCADLVDNVRTVLDDNGLNHIPIFRNITRMNVFDVMNDHDGSGLDLLSQKLDIIHIDPYPVNDIGYDSSLIIRDMTYAEGLARRHHKKLLPWMQAHVYGHLNHPNKADIKNMVEQQTCFNTDAIMWLGYAKSGSGNTFPKNDSLAWQEAAIQHAIYKNSNLNYHAADMAVIRPYTVRSLRGMGMLYPQDQFFTDIVLEYVVFEKNLRYDPFEPLQCSDLNAKDLQAYPFVIAEIGILDKKHLQPFYDSKVPSILFIEGADFVGDLKSFGITQYKGKNKQIQSHLKKETIQLLSLDNYQLNKSCEVLLKAENIPVAWKNKNVLYVAGRTDSVNRAFFDFLLKEINIH